MRWRVTICCLILLAACGGGGGGGGAAPPETATQSRLRALDGWRDAVAGRGLTDISRGVTGSPYIFNGYAGLRRLSGGGTMTDAAMQKAVVDLTRDLHIDAPEVTGRVSLAFYFDTETFTGSIGDFRRDTDTPVAGSLTVSGGAIEDGFNHYLSRLSGSYDGAAVRSGMLYGDFIGAEGQHVDGSLVFSTDGIAMTGVFLGAR